MSGCPHVTCVKTARRLRAPFLAQLERRRRSCAMSSAGVLLRRMPAATILADLWLSVNESEGLGVTAATALGPSSTGHRRRRRSRGIPATARSLGRPYGSARPRLARRAISSVKRIAGTGAGVLAQPHTSDDRRRRTAVVVLPLPAAQPRTRTTRAFRSSETSSAGSSHLEASCTVTQRA